MPYIKSWHKSEVVTQEMLRDGRERWCDCVFKGLIIMERDICTWECVNCIFVNCSFRGSTLRGTRFDGCWFMQSMFDYAHIQDSVFRECNIDYCSFYRTTIERSVFNNCIITRTSLACINECEDVDLHVPLACPSEGAFIGWKQAELHHGSGRYELILIKLLIPEDAKRSSATSNKCRCNKAKVLGFYTLRGDEIKDIGPNSKVVSTFDRHFEYHVGETVAPELGFNDNRWDECASGIHFFVDREVAIRY